MNTVEMPILVNIVLAQSVLVSTWFLTLSNLEKLTCSGGSFTNVDIPTSIVMSWLR